MQAISDYFASHGMDIAAFLKGYGLIILAVLVICLIFRFVFRKLILLNEAMSSVIGILFIYAVTVLVKQFFPQFEQFLTPLPFVTFSGDTMAFFSFIGADYLAVCGQILNMIILAFLVNLLDHLLPEGKNILTWLIFRCVTVAAAMLLHLFITGLLLRFLPEGLTTYAPVILLAVLAIMLLTGFLKIIVGAVLTTVNPLIAALYTFFFANVVGKQVTKAVLTTAVLSLLFFGINKAGITSVSVAPEILSAYIPFLIALLVIWFVMFRVLNIRKRHRS